jgi:hypothetical protein
MRVLIVDEAKFYGEVGESKLDRARPCDWVV